jgi:hypothetical protein
MSRRNSDGSPEAFMRARTADLRGEGLPLFGGEMAPAPAGASILTIEPGYAGGVTPTFDRSTGQARKQAALTKHEAEKAVPLERVRSGLRVLYLERAARDPVGAVVTADDAARLVERWPAELRPSSNAWMGSIFRGESWVKVGWQASERVGNNGRQIMAWRWNGTRPSGAT